MAGGVVWIVQWATLGPKVREDQRTVEEMEADGWVRWKPGGVDQRYPHSVLMRKDDASE